MIVIFSLIGRVEIERKMQVFIFEHKSRFWKGDQIKFWAFYLGKLLPMCISSFEHSKPTIMITIILERAYHSHKEISNCILLQYIRIKMNDTTVFCKLSIKHSLIKRIFLNILQNLFKRIRRVSCFMTIKEIRKDIVRKVHNIKVMRIIYKSIKKIKIICFVFYKWKCIFYSIENKFLIKS